MRPNAILVEAANSGPGVWRRELNEICAARTASCIAAHATQPVVKWALETYGVLPYCWRHWVEFHPKMQFLEEPYNGRAQGRLVRYGIRTHDMDYERARVQQFETLARSGLSPTPGP